MTFVSENADTVRPLGACPASVRDYHRAYKDERNFQMMKTTPRRERSREISAEKTLDGFTIESAFVRAFRLLKLINPSCALRRAKRFN
jgi:hypothetical protein